VNEQQANEQGFASFGYRASVDVTPGVDFLWAPWLERNEEAPAHQQVFVKVLEAEQVFSPATGDRGVRFLLELPSGRTYVRTLTPHRHLTTFYRRRVTASV
jgi:hypothetical protein